MNLKDIKAGDSVILERNHNIRTIVKVTRTTATQIIIGGATEGTERKFSRNSGKEVGDRGFFVPWIMEATAERIVWITDQRKRINLIATIRNANFSRLSTDKLAAIVQLLELPQV